MSKAESPGHDGVIRKLIWSMFEVSARLTRRKGKIDGATFMQLMRRKVKGRGGGAVGGKGCSLPIFLASRHLSFLRQPVSLDKKALGNHSVFQSCVSV